MERGINSLDNYEEKKEFNFINGVNSIETIIII